MFNLKHKLTINDLVIIYLAEKLKGGGYNFLDEEEFSDFIHFFNEQKNTKFSFEDYNKFIQKVIDKKMDRDWKCGTHIYIDQDNIVRANYHFSNFDENTSAIGFMNKDDKKIILKIIREYISKLPKREIKEQFAIEPEMLEIGFLYSALMVNGIWSYYRDKYVKNQLWPKQCSDIERYLLEQDFALLIDLPSIRKDLMSFYKTFAYRMATLIQLEKKVEFSSSKNNLLAYSNYMYCTNGFDILMNYLIDKRIDIYVNLYNNLREIYPSVISKKYGRYNVSNNINNDENARILVKILNKYSNL